MNYILDNFIIDYSVVILVSIFILLIINYKKILFKINNNIKYLLLFNRSLILLALAIIFINPIILNRNINKGNVAFIIDNSKSMFYNYKDINLEDNLVYEKINSWLIKNNYSPKYYIFGERFMHVNDLNEIDYSDLYTDMNSMINSIDDDVLIITDGINNYGVNNFNLKNKNNINILGIGNPEKLNNDISIQLISSKLENDSIKFNIELDNNLYSKLEGQNIYLSNSNLNNLIIDKFNLMDNSYKFSKSITISKSLFQENNIIFINRYKNEIDYVNNSFVFTIDQNELISKKVLFISGSISDNTKYIKNYILSNLLNYNIYHYFRVNKDVWNKNINDIDYDKYDLVVLDNFPLYSNDNGYINKLLSNYNNKIIYFLGPHEILSNSLLFDYCNCNYNYSSIKVSNTRSSLLQYRNNLYNIPPSEVFYDIYCNNSIYNYDNSNTLLYENNNILLFFVSNIREYKESTRLSNQNSSYIIDDYFDNYIYSNSKYFDIFTNQNEYSINDSLVIYLQLNDDIKYEMIYVDIFNSDYSLYNRIYDKQIIKDDLLLFKYQINKEADYYIQAFMNIDNNSTLNSNMISISFNSFSSELKKIYLNSDLLYDISSKTGGVFSTYNQIDQFLDSIEFSKSSNVNYQRNNLISYPYLFLILIILLSIEWYFRNKVGLI